MSGLLEIFPPQPYLPAPYGLLSLRDPDVTEDERWLGGFTYESRLCTATINLLDICGGASAVNLVAKSTDPRNRTFQPYAVEAEDSCSTFGFEARDAEQRALDALEACTPKAVEHEFWTGSLATTNGYANNRYLASTDTVDVTPGGGPVKVRYGLAILEQALAACGCGTRGTIHVTHDVGSVIPVRVVEEHLETQLGNFVVAGAGYTGSGPDGTIPGTGTWMYATGPVRVLLGPMIPTGVTMAQQVDRTINTWDARAQRAAAATWDGCCAFAVHVDLALDYA